MSSLKVATDEVTSDPFDIAYKDKTVLIAGHTWRLRELSVEENDDCLAKSRKPDDTIDGRVLLRWQITKSVTEPVVTLERIARLPNRVFLLLADTVNDLMSEVEAQPVEPKNA